MPRPVSRRRLVVAAALVGLAVVPNVIKVQAAVAANHLPASKIAWVIVRLPLNPRPYYLFDVSSLESAKAIESGWEMCRRRSWIFALVAAFVVVRDFLRHPRVSGRNDAGSRQPARLIRVEMRADATAAACAGI